MSSFGQLTSLVPNVSRDITVSPYFFSQGACWLLGSSGKDDGSGVGGSGVEQEVGKMGIRVWREKWLRSEQYSFKMEGRNRDGATVVFKRGREEGLVWGIYKVGPW
nr:hypothetical protein [Tanacetum cinerariifolium]